MPEDLKNLLHESADLDFATPDIGAITRAGDRRLRHRRLVTGAVGLAAAAVVAGGVVLTTGGDDSSRVATEPPASSLPAGLSWAEGTVIHSSSGDIDTGHRVHAYVRAGNGYAFTDGDGAVFAVTGGEVKRIGSIGKDGPRLVADPSGSLVAWLDQTGEVPTYHDYDLATGESGTWTAEVGEAEFAGVVGVDGRDVVWSDLAGENAWNADEGTVTKIDARPTTGTRLIGAGGGLLAWSGQQGLLVGRDRDSARVLKDLYGSRAVISPDGKWVSVDADEMEVHDTRTGAAVKFDVDGRDFATGYEWLDADTIAAIAVRHVAESGDTGLSPFELLTCEVPSGACTTVLELGDDKVFGRQRTVAIGTAPGD